jgi:hypothetical protein
MSEPSGAGLAFLVWRPFPRGEGGGRPVPPRLHRVVEDADFEEMQKTAADLNFEVGQLEAVDTFDLRNAVRDRIRWHRDTADPPDAQRELMNRVLELLENPRLSPKQAAQLERLFFRQS